MVAQCLNELYHGWLVNCIKSTNQVTQVFLKWGLAELQQLVSSLREKTDRNYVKQPSKMYLELASISLPGFYNFLCVFNISLFAVLGNFDSSRCEKLIFVSIIHITVSWKKIDFEFVPLLCVADSVQLLSAHLYWIFWALAVLKMFLFPLVPVGGTV